MNHFQKYLVEEFAEDYQEGHLSRREALKLIAGVTGSLLLANTILAACSPPPESPSVTLAGETPAPSPTSEPAPLVIEPTATQAEPTPEITQATPEGDASVELEIDAGDLQIPAEGKNLIAYLSHPAGTEPLPVVLVCHENRGLTEHIKDVTRRLAATGYVALAVDLLSHAGGTAALSTDQAPGVLGNTPADQFFQDFQSGWKFLQGKPYADATKVGMTGFCFGGGVTWLVAAQMPELLAAVPFYGPHPPVETVPNIQAAVLAIYAGNDQRINLGIPVIEEAMLSSGKTYEKIIYPGTDHAFHNDTGSRYNPEAAQDAWSKTLEWFGRYLKGA